MGPRIKPPYWQDRQCIQNRRKQLYEKFCFFKACLQVNDFLRSEKTERSSNLLLSLFLKKDIFL
jgi:hypothetical protein